MRQEYMNGKNIKRRDYKMCPHTKGAKPFLMPDEENLCGFTWIGFHVFSYLCVFLMIVFMSNAYMLWMRWSECV